MLARIIVTVLLWQQLSSVYCNAQCPSVDVKPCSCGKDYNEVKDGKPVSRSVLDCYGKIDLPKLTDILRNKMCGRTVHEVTLTSSAISYLPSNLFSRLKVESIKISSTNISHFTEAGRSAFYGLEKYLRVLSMRRCRLVDKLRWEKIGELDILETLDLSKNSLTTIPRQWFDHPPKRLKFLHLEGNRISYIQPGALANMHNLVTVDLSENLLTSLERNVFPYPGNSIIILRLSYNRLSSLPTDFFDEMFGLRKVYLDHNHLTALDAKIWLVIWGELTLLDVSDNNITCDCDIKWISYLEEIKYLWGSCGEGSALSGSYIASLFYWNFDEMNCTSTGL